MGEDRIFLSPSPTLAHGWLLLLSLSLSELPLLRAPQCVWPVRPAPGEVGCWQTFWGLSWDTDGHCHVPRATRVPRSLAVETPEYELLQSTDLQAHVQMYSTDYLDPPGVNSGRTPGVRP